VPAAAAEGCEDAASGVACDNHPKIVLAAPGEMHGLVNEDVWVKSVMHGEFQRCITAPLPGWLLQPRAIP
jgi:hypothetical protein